MEGQSQTNIKILKKESNRAIEILTPAQAIVKHHKEGKKLIEFSKAVPDYIIKRFQLDLLNISKHLGIQNPPDEGDLVIIIQFLVNNFKDFTPAEVYHAFELYAAGTLTTVEIAGRSQAIEKPYGTFNLSFIGNVLNAYRMHRKATIKQDPVPVERQIESAKTMNDDEFNQTNHEFIKKYIDENKQLPIVASYASAYKHLEKTGAVILTAEEKETFLYQFRESEIARLQNTKTLNPFERHKIDMIISQLLNEKSEYLKNAVREAYAKLFYTEYLKTKI
jgi:hypothetical protein